MEVTTYEGRVENGQIKLNADVRLPENAIVYVVVKPATERVYKMMSPRVIGTRPELRIEILRDESPTNKV
jgi:hypothetical protein